VLLELSGFNGFGRVRNGVGRVQAGIGRHDFDRQARPYGWKLRWLPSAFRSATLGGRFGGGFGSAGSITCGPVPAPGNAPGCTGDDGRGATARPRTARPRRHAPASHPRHQRVSCSRLEMALGPALPWLESIASFASFDAALESCSVLAGAPGLVTKEVCFFAAPGTGHMTSLAESSQAVMLDLLAMGGGEIT
jgi:hypothetical protein